MTYAVHTNVTEPESIAEVEALLTKYGAAWTDVGLNKAGDAVVKFGASGRSVRMLVAMPASQPRERPRRWRVLVLLLKAKLEAVNSGLATFEDEFLANIFLPDCGRTVGQVMAPRINDAYLLGR